MSRTDVEKSVAALLDRPDRYSPYRDDVSGGVVEYRESAWTLRVRYAAGSFAYWVANASGVGVHFPPVDQTVISHEFVPATGRAAK